MKYSYKMFKSIYEQYYIFVQDCTSAEPIKIVRYALCVVFSQYIEYWKCILNFVNKM